jgi:hypothetical protein
MSALSQPSIGAPLRLQRLEGPLAFTGQQDARWSVQVDHEIRRSHCPSQHRATPLSRSLPEGESSAELEWLVVGQEMPIEDDHETTLLVAACHHLSIDTLGQQIDELEDRSETPGQGRARPANLARPTGRRLRSGPTLRAAQHDHQPIERQQVVAGVEIQSHVDVLRRNGKATLQRPADGSLASSIRSNQRDRRHAHSPADSSRAATTASREPGYGW